MFSLVIGESARKIRQDSEELVQRVIILQQTHFVGALVYPCLFVADCSRRFPSLQTTEELL